MPDISLGIIIVLITIAGSISNWLNWRYLNYGPVRLLYYVGAFVHELSHAILCVLTGAKIEEFTVFSNQPRVVHRQSKIPFVGELLISSAPIAGGLFFLFLVNRYLLGNYFILPIFSSTQDWHTIFAVLLAVLSQINLLHWQSWVMILLSLNAGAMLGPSPRDLRNFWPMLVILFFVPSPLLAGVGFIALSLIAANIVFQIVAIVLVRVGRLSVGRS
jgi:hypothetical protein